MALATTILAAAPALGAPTIRPDEWSAYRQNYVTDTGRVVDTANGNISHSESQGYGLLLAYLADDRPTFEAIWSFTRTELMVRPDGLAAWRWEEDKTPHVTDTNNASDGDILIAYALGLAGQAWNDPGKLDAARVIVSALGDDLLVQINGLRVTLPGVEGFAVGHRDDAPVVNPSYWIWETRPVFQQLDPDTDWQSVGEDELKLLALSSDSAAGLPPDWVSLAEDDPRPADGFPPEFGYNNIRVPLYLMRAGAPAEALEPFRAMADDDGLKRIDVTTGEVKEHLTEPGYQLIGAALACVLDGKPVPADASRFAPTSYYAATLQLLALDFLRRERAQCLTEDSR